VWSGTALTPSISDRPSSKTAQTAWAVLIASFADGGTMPSSRRTLMKVSSIEPAEAPPADESAASPQGGCDGGSADEGGEVAKGGHLLNPLVVVVSLAGTRRFRPAPLRILGKSLVPS
jgi:hypothetical protein